MQYYHRKHKTPVLRIGPNTLSVSDGTALHSIYVASSGFPKSARYENFKVSGVHTIFSSRDTEYRDVRAKAVAPIFAMGRIKVAGESTGIVGKCVDRFVERFENEKTNAMMHAPLKAKSVNVLELTYRLTLDSVTGFLFNRTYGALDEETASRERQMSALPFFYAILEAGRFSLLPNQLFRALQYTLGRLFPDHGLHDSIKDIHDFAAEVTQNANLEKNDTYQSRLLAAGVSESETIIQCMAVMFAGADSTAVKLVTIIFHLVQNPSIHKRLREELQSSSNGPTKDLQALPYLRAVVREGLRLGMANPARFSRTVPPAGFEVHGFRIPGGTDIGIAPYVLHHNPEIFPEPFEFHPERWLDSRGTKQMERDLIPFSTGSRACIAKTLATHVLFVATSAIVESRVLEGARTCSENIELEEYFNVQIKDHKLEIEWST